MTERNGPVVLLVEDSPDDVVLARFAINAARVEWRVLHVSDGEDAVQYLRGSGLYSDRSKYPLPNLILTDLKMPGLDGFGFLAWIQKRPEFDYLTTVVLSSSNLDSDIARAKTLGADDYLVKPTEIGHLTKIFLALDCRWFCVINSA